MSARQKNNPILVGLLLVVFVGAIGMTVSQLRGSDVVALVPTGPAAAPAVALQTIAQPDAPVLTMTRDPFYHRALETSGPAPAAGPTGAPATEKKLGSWGGAAPFIPYPGSVHALPGASVPGTLPPMNGGTTLNVRPVPPLVERSQKLRLTAVLGGARMMAILEGTGPEPLTVSVGDSIAGIGARVVAIRPREMVLSDRAGFWTLPLAGPAAGARAEQEIGFARPDVSRPEEKRSNVHP